MAVWWLRKGLQNLAASRLLPIEYGTFTSSSMLAGLVVFDEARGISSQQLTQMAFGCALMVAGCVLVGSRKALRVEMRCYVNCSSDDVEAEVEGVMERRSALLPSTSPGQAALRLLMPNAKRSDAPESPPPAGLLAPEYYDANGLPTKSQSARGPPGGGSRAEGASCGGAAGGGRESNQPARATASPVTASMPAGAVPPLRIISSVWPIGNPSRSPKHSERPPPPPASIRPISNPASRPMSLPASQPASHPASRPSSKDATPRSPSARPPSRNSKDATATPRNAARAKATLSV